MTTKKVSFSHTLSNHKALVLVGVLAVSAFMLALVAVAQVQRSRSVAFKANTAQANSSYYDDSCGFWESIWSDCPEVESGDQKLLYRKPTVPNRPGDTSGDREMPTRDSAPVDLTANTCANLDYANAHNKPGEQCWVDFCGDPNFTYRNGETGWGCYGNNPNAGTCEDPSFVIRNPNQCPGGIYTGITPPLAIPDRPSDTSGDRNMPTRGLMDAFLDLFGW